MKNMFLFFDARSHAQAVETHVDPQLPSQIQLGVEKYRSRPGEMSYKQYTFGKKNLFKNCIGALNCFETFAQKISYM